MFLKWREKLPDKIVEIKLKQFFSIVTFFDKAILYLVFVNFLCEVCVYFFSLSLQPLDFVLGKVKSLVEG